MGLKLPAQTLQRVEHMDVRLNSPGSLPYLRRGATANTFRDMRAATERACGFDFLQHLDLMLLLRNHESALPGVKGRSRLKRADCFVYNSADPRILLVEEPKTNKAFWRTYLLCDAPYGKPMTLPEVVGRRRPVEGRFFDF